MNTTTFRFVLSLAFILISLSDSLAYADSQSSLKIIRLDYGSTEDAPSEIRKDLRKIIDAPTTDQKIPISVYFSLTNDFNFLRIVGVQKNTDDFGYTHGTEIKIIGNLPNEYTLSLNYTTDLYTSPVNGELQAADPTTNKVKQYFTDENILKMIITHKPENKLYFWKAEAGWIEIDSEYRKRFLKASTQQKLFHDSVNAIQSQTTKDPDFINGEKGNRDGLLAGIYIGMAKSYFKDSDLCKKAIESQIGVRSSTIPGTTLRMFDAQLALDCSYKFTKNHFRFETGYQITDHEDGTQRQQYFDFSTKRKKLKYGFRVENNTGNLVNYVDYNLPNVDDGTIDPIFRIYFQRDLN